MDDDIDDKDDTKR